MKTTLHDFRRTEQLGRFARAKWVSASAVAVFFIGVLHAQTGPAGKPAPSANPAAVAAENPFTQAAKAALAAYAGRFRGQMPETEESIEVRLKPSAGQWTGAIFIMGKTYSLSARVRVGRLEGQFGGTGQAAPFPFTATVEGDKLHFISGKSEATLARQALPKLAGVWGSTKVTIEFENTGPRYSGRIKYTGLQFTFAAEEVAGDLEGVFKTGQMSYPFTLANEASGLVFTTGDFAELIYPLVARYRAKPLGSLPTWTNTLGMTFRTVPGTDVLFSLWDTRVRDYSAYARMNENVDSAWRSVELNGIRISDGPDHPVTMVSWEEAKAFCKWLTEQEQADGLLGKGQYYRLPADAEWSKAVGLPDETGSTPKEKDGKIKDVYPWGQQWPPPAGAGNYADRAFKLRFPDYAAIEGYDDGFATTSPVGSFKANRYGLFDMGGNVWQWCEDWYDGEKEYRVLRGPSWRSYDQDRLLSSFRNGLPPGGRDDFLGFRVVLVGTSSR